MNRRRLLLAAMGGAGLLTEAGTLRAQTAGPRRVGVLAPSTAAREEVTLRPFFDQMRQLGWVEGQNVAYDRVYADDRQESLPRLAADLVARKPDLIYAPPTPAAVAAKQATRDIPIVFGAVWNPVSTGLVASLSRPGGNLTGVCVLADSLTPKRFQLLREVLPRARRIGWLGDATDVTPRVEYESFIPLAAAQGLSIEFAEGSNPDSVLAAVGRLLDERIDVLYSGTSPLLYNLRARLIDLATSRRIPTIAYRAQFAESGALFAYGASLPDQLRRSAFLADKILGGAKPADLAVEQATLFELVVNLKAARTLGVALPKSFLLRADRVIA